MNLATYCLIFGSAGFIVSAFAIPKLRQLIRQNRKCSNNEICNISDVDELLKQAKKNKENNKDGLLKL